MIEKLDALEERFKLVSERISDPDVIANRNEWREYCREHSELSPIVDEYNNYKKLIRTIEDDKEMHLH